MKSFVSLCCVLLLSIAAGNHSYACTGQDHFNCNACTTESDHVFKICIGGSNYWVTVTYCKQVGTGGNAYVENPTAFYCGNPCEGPLDELIWIRKVCIPSSLLTTPLSTVYSAIYKSMDLCCNNWLGVTIPNCDAGTDCHYTAMGVHCIGLAFPRCVKLDVNNCWVPCESNCERFCVIDRRYCNQFIPDPPPNGHYECCSHELHRCTIGLENCTGSCGQQQPVDCDEIVDYTGCCS